MCLRSCTIMLHLQQSSPFIPSVVIISWDKVKTWTVSRLPRQRHERRQFQLQVFLKIPSSSWSPCSFSLDRDRDHVPSLGEQHPFAAFVNKFLLYVRNEEVCSLPNTQSVPAERCIFLHLSLCRFTQSVARLLRGPDGTGMFVGLKSMTQLTDPKASPVPPAGWVGPLSAGIPADTLCTCTFHSPFKFFPSSNKTIGAFFGKYQPSLL